jgi:type III restriction enzyme
LEEVDKETHKKSPFLGFEMATGSGKTMLMGSSVYFLNKKFGINNFLIITPSSTDIYQKTIRNFTVGGYDSVWADDTPFTFNLITGDNYTQNLFYDKSKDANIFIFNISKFGTNATNTEKTWESAVWQIDGNSISIKEFLKGEKLIIITDEAHHHQSPAAKKIINNFHPNAVIEFTATAIESERGQDRKNQQIVYKYDIRSFLEDGHGKLVRAVALATETKKTKDEILQSEKLKLITLFFIHLLKKKAVLLDPKCRELKPIAFVKVKEDTTYTKKIFDYIRNDLANDLENINIILDKVKAQDLDITGLLTDLYNEDYDGNLELLRADIQKTANSTIFYFGKSDKDTEKKFLNIRRNEVEIVVYMQRLDEGIDLPNIYTMAVINDTESNFQTSVKQIIGRGVRLNKDKREFDDSQDSLIQQSEKLHIVCDQGKSFQDVILRIQQEFGLNSKYLSFDKP